MPPLQQQPGDPRDPVSGFSLRRWLSGFVTAFVAPAAIRVDEGDMPYVLQPFAGSTGSSTGNGNPLALPGSASGSVSFQIPNNCVIEVDDWKATSSAVTSSTPQGAPLGFNVTVAWNGNQNLLTPFPVPGEFLFATSNSYRAPWSPRPWIVTYRTGNAGPQSSFSNLTFNLTNTLTTTNTIYFALMGWNRIRGAGA